MTRRVYDVLYDFCMDASMEGYGYIRSALLICADNPKAVYDMDGVYKAIASQNNVSWDTVCCAMQQVIDDAFTRLKKEECSKYIDQDIYGRYPTAKAFITALTMYLISHEGEEQEGVS